MIESRDRTRRSDSTLSPQTGSLVTSRVVVRRRSLARLTRRGRSRGDDELCAGEDDRADGAPGGVHDPGVGGGDLRGGGRELLVGVLTQPGYQARASTSIEVLN